MKTVAYWVGVLVVALIGWHSSAEAMILINEVLADPPSVGGDANHDGVVSSTQDEFVELVNPTADAVSLSGWTLSDAVQVRHVFAADTAVPSGGFFVVFGGGSPSGFARATIASTGTLSLNNSGDSVVLRDATAALIDSFTYGSEGGADVSLTRAPDGSGAFVKHTTVSTSRFSPGTTIDGRSALAVPDGSGIGPPAAAPPSMPEPSSWALIGFGLLGVIPPRWRFRRR